MKKILAFLLAATMLCALFVLPSAADDKKNFEVDIPYVSKAPSIDGTVKSNEYGSSFALHTYSDNKEQFEDTEHNQFTDWDFDFHMAWDADNLYMAWVVDSDVHAGLPEQDFTSDGIFDENDYPYMWQYSCVQFIFTPGAPDGTKVYQTADYSGNYLEVGLCLSAEGKQCRAVWSRPVGAEALDVNDWDAIINRDDAAGTTTYEVRIPWGKSGIKEVGNGAQFGLTYAVAAQEDYNVKRGMIEWQDAVLGGKNADNAAIVTLTGNEKIEKSENSAAYSQAPVEELKEGTLPEYVTADTVKLGLDSVNTGIIGESSVLYTAADKMENTKWAHCLLLEPMSGDRYKVIETKTGAGEEVVFENEFKKGMLVAAFHSDGADGSTGKERREAAMALQAGDEVGLFGINLADAKRQYSNAMLFVYTETIGGGDESSEVVDDSSEVVDESSEVVDESSEAESSVAESSVADESSKTEESKTTSSTDSSVGDDEGGSLTWLWIVLGVVGVAAVAVVVVIVLKKKNA